MERDPFDVELEMLREFYDAWTGLQNSIANHHPRFTLERKAQALTEAHHALKAFNAPSKIWTTDKVNQRELETIKKDLSFCDSMNSVYDDTAGSIKNG